MAWPGRSEKDSSRNVISKDVILFVFVAYNEDMSPDSIMSPDMISDIISDGMENFRENFEKEVWKEFCKGPVGRNRNKQNIRSKRKRH